MRAGRWLVVAAALAATLAACAQVGAQPGRVGIPRGGSSAVVHGEVRSVDTRAGRIQVRQERGGNRTIRVDGRTSVVHRQQRYPLSALERGDRVTVRLTNDRRGQAVATRIEVRESVRDDRRGRDRDRAPARVERVEGRVGWVDARQGAFGVSMRRGQDVTVYAPRGISRSDRQRLDRLRRGSTVRVDVRPVGRGTYELVRFR